MLGYLATTPAEYANCLSTVLDQLEATKGINHQSRDSGYTRMQRTARQTATERFSDVSFDQLINLEFQRIFQYCV